MLYDETVLPWEIEDQFPTKHNYGRLNNIALFDRNTYQWQEEIFVWHNQKIGIIIDNPYNYDVRFVPEEFVYAYWDYIEDGFPDLFYSKDMAQLCAADFPVVARGFVGYLLNKYQSYLFNPEDTYETYFTDKWEENERLEAKKPRHKRLPIIQRTKSFLEEELRLIDGSEEVYEYLSKQDQADVFDYVVDFIDYILDKIYITLSEKTGLKVEQVQNELKSTIEKFQHYTNTLLEKKQQTATSTQTNDIKFKEEFRSTETSSVEDVFSSVTTTGQSSASNDFKVLNVTIHADNVNLGEIKTENNPKPEVTEVKEDDGSYIPTGEEVIQNEIINKVDHFNEVVKAYSFYNCPKVKCLNKKQKGLLVKNLVNRKDARGAYAIAMLCFLEYDKWIQEQFAKANPHSKSISKENLFKHITDALSLTNERDIKGNYNIIRVENSTEDKDKYQSWSFEKQVQEDYEAIKKA